MIQKRLIVFAESYLIQLRFKATRIPNSLNVPGLLGTRGHLDFHEEVFADLTETEHNIEVAVISFRPP